ncbi:MAG: acyltransferase [Nostoc sp. ChiSLP02]|nr:acyltransferase [Nostoc sp. DedSLP05]MDZ8100820.1 acyltransferase [Nostoc sp. DedSLP01]MDZ8188191.1 acyltransferase [Nostoc sp. ChiSLP02]
MAEVRANSRIVPVDGLRGIAVLGVVWAHVWFFCGNPILSLGKIASIDLDLNRAVSMIGTGVDMFFVISGFCMYLMYTRQQTQFAWTSYVTFLKNRWLRIAPAFYISASVCAIIYIFVGKSLPWVDLLSHASFTHIFFPNTGRLASPFWSLATEWHFYLFVPLFIWAAAQWGFWPVITVTILFSMGCRTWMYASPAELELIWKPQIPIRLVEFAWGMCIAWLYIKKIMPPKILSAEKGFLIAFSIAYFGRLLMVTEVVNLASSFGYICKILAEPVLTLGYSLMLWNAIASSSVFEKWLSHRFIQAIGRWSYSLYLWHWYPCAWISQLVAKQFGETPFTQHIALILSLVVLIPLSSLSYHWLEAPYFRKRHSQALV